MIYDIDANCGNCPLIGEREAMLTNWRAFELSVDDNPVQQLTQEGSFTCGGPKKWAIGPLVLSYSCRAENYQPQAEIVTPDQRGSQE